MLLAWSITEVVRYTYFAVLLNRTRILDKNSSRTSNSNNSRISGGGSSSSSEKNPAILDDQPPPWLTWSRYNLFFVLYPLGILSEMRLIYLAIEPASQAFSAAADHDESKYKERVGWFLWAILAVYVPGTVSPPPFFPSHIWSLSMSLCLFFFFFHCSQNDIHSIMLRGGEFGTALLVK